MPMLIISFLYLSYFLCFCSVLCNIFRMFFFYIYLTVPALDHSNIKMMVGMVEQNDDGDDDDLQAFPTTLSLSLPERK